MAWEASSTDVVFPSAELLQSAYEAVRPRLRPEDVPAALTRDIISSRAQQSKNLIVGPGVCTLGAKQSVVLPTSRATSDVSPVVSPCSKTDERSSLTTDISGLGGHGHECELANQQQQKWQEKSKHRGAQRKKLSRPARGGFRPSAADAEHRHERVIQHRDRSTTYTLGGPRCSRTDGKHWQCKREALPEQKYCEKHLHRGLLRSRKRKRGDEYQDVEGERLFQGWQRAKPKLWPGLCRSPPLKDENPTPSQSPPSSQALFSPPSRQLPSSENPAWLAAGPQTVGQWTPAQEQILKATLSELGLEEKQALAGTSSAVRAAVAELSREVLQHVREDPPWADLQCDPMGPPGPFLQPPQAPNILRVGQDQAVLPPSARIALGEDGSFLVPIPIACLASVGISVNADGLVSTWGSGVPIYIALGETSELVKLEALKPDGETVVFKGRPRMQLSSAGGAGRLAIAGDLSPGGIETATTKPPWDGKGCAQDSAMAVATKGLNLDLNLHAAATNTGAPTRSPLDPCNTGAAQIDSGPGFLDQYPRSTMKQGSIAARDASSPFLRTVDAQAPDAGLGEWLANQWGTGPMLEMLHQLQWERGVEQRAQINPPADPVGKGSSLYKASSPSVDISEVGDASLQRTASLPAGFEPELLPPESSPPFPTVLNPAPRSQTEGAVALGGPRLGPMGGALVGRVASVILQTPQGVFLGGGGQLDEKDTEGSCGGTPPSRGERRTLSDGQGSQCGPGDESTDSASSLLRGHKRGLQVGALMGGWKAGFQVPPGQGREKGLRTEHRMRVPNKSLSISDLDGVAPGCQRAPGRAPGVAKPAESGVTGLRTDRSDARAFELQLLSAAAGMRYRVGEMQGGKHAGAKEKMVDNQEARSGLRMFLPSLGAQKQQAWLLTREKEKVIERQSWELPGLTSGRWTSSAMLKSTPAQESAFGRPQESPGLWNTHRL